MPQGEFQAWGTHRTGLADPLGLVSLDKGRAGRAFWEEELGIMMAARGVITPVRVEVMGVPSSNRWHAISP